MKPTWLAIFLALNLPVFSQTITGRVLDYADQSPVKDCYIMVQDSVQEILHTVRSDSIGFYNLILPDTNSYCLQTYRYGYKKNFGGPYQVNAKDTLFLLIPLMRDTIMTQSISVVQARIHHKLKQIGFYQRKNKAGVFYSYEDLQNMNLTGMSDLLRRFMILEKGQTHWHFKSARPGKRQRLPVFINQYEIPEDAEIDIDDLVQPDGLIGVEFYSSNGTLPGQFDSFDMKPGLRPGALILWTL